jgi:hypothetical protein
MDTIVSLTVAIDVPLHRQLCKLATVSGRSTSWLIDQALRRYISAEMAVIEAVPTEDGPVGGAAGGKAVDGVAPTSRRHRRTR